MADTQQEVDNIIDALIIDNNTMQVSPAKVRAVCKAINHRIQTGDASIVTASEPLNFDPFNNNFSINQAGSDSDGYLSKEDWNTFNDNVGAGTVTNVSGSDGVVVANSTTTPQISLGSITPDSVDSIGPVTGSNLSGTNTGDNAPNTNANAYADSKISQVITDGITDKAPSENAVFDAFALKVPYTGATGNVDLGDNQIKVDQIEFDQTPTGTFGVGKVRWNDTDGTTERRLKGNNVTLQDGQEVLKRVVNKTGSDLLQFQYKVVRLRSVSEGGAQGQRSAVVLAQADTNLHSKSLIGVVTESIANNQEGFVTLIGEVRDINTTGSLQSETWVDGDQLYLSDTVAGGLTKIIPVSPNYLIPIATVDHSHAVNGKISVHTQSALALDVALSGNDETAPSVKAVKAALDLKENIIAYKQQALFDFNFNTNIVQTAGFTNTAINGGALSLQSDSITPLSLRTSRGDDISECWVVRGNAGSPNGGFTVGVASQNAFYVGHVMFMAIDVAKITDTNGRFGLVFNNAFSPLTSIAGNNAICVEIVGNQLTFKTSVAGAGVSIAPSYTIPATQWLYIMIEAESATTIRCKIRNGLNGPLVYNELITSATNIPLSSNLLWNQLRISLNAVATVASADNMFQYGKVATYAKKPNFLNYF